jgi:hypothetical protein
MCRRDRVEHTVTRLNQASTPGETSNDLRLDRTRPCDKRHGNRPKPEQKTPSMQIWFLLANMNYEMGE